MKMQQTWGQGKDLVFSGPSNNIYNSKIKTKPFPIMDHVEHGQVRKGLNKIIVWHLKHGSIDRDDKTIKINWY